MGKNDFCCAPRCSNNRKRNPNLKFYRTPKECKRRKAWLERIRRQDFEPTNNTRLCSAHFVGGEKSDNDKHPAFNPSIFEFKRGIKRRDTRTNQKTNEDDFVETPKPKRKRVSCVSGEVKGRPRNAVESLEDHEIWGACLPVEHPLKVHDYCKAQVDPKSVQLSDEIIQELSSLQSKVSELENENKKVHAKCLLLDEIKQDNEKFRFCTSLPNYDTFKGLFNYLSAIGLDKKKCWRGSEMALRDCQLGNKPGPSSKLPLEELFMVTVRLRVGLTLPDLALRFGISEASVSKNFSAWINLLHFQLKDLCQMPDYEEYGKPTQFSSFPDLKVIVDCTEIFTQKPSSLKACKEVYSNYKSHTTFKFLVAINAHGAIVYVSRAWGGRTSTNTSQQTVQTLLLPSSQGMS